MRDRVKVLVIGCVVAEMVKIRLLLRGSREGMTVCVSLLRVVAVTWASFVPLSAVLAVMTVTAAVLFSCPRVVGLLLGWNGLPRFRFLNLDFSL